MLLHSELFKEKSAKTLEHSIKTENSRISDYDKIELINKIVLDRRLGSTDMKVYTFLLNFREKDYSQEEIAYELAITRMSVNKSINKLIAFNYISIEKQFSEVSSYFITEYKDAGICKTDINSLVKIFNLDTKVGDRFVDNSIDLECNTKTLENEWNNFNNSLEEQGINIVSQDVQSILSNDNYKLVLFIAKSNNRNIKAFKDKYFESLVRFYNKFAGLWNRDFLKLYYKMLSDNLYLFKSDKKKGYSIENIMFYADISNSSDKRVSNKFKNDINDRFDNFLSNYTKLLYTIENQDIKLPEHIYNIAKRINLESKQFSLEELIVIAIIGDFVTKFEKKVGILFTDFLECVDNNLLKNYNLFLKEKEVLIKEK